MTFDEKRESGAKAIQPLNNTESYIVIIKIVSKIAQFYYNWNNFENIK